MGDRYMSSVDRYICSTTRFQTSCPNRVSKQALHSFHTKYKRFFLVVCLETLYAKLVWKLCLDSLFGILFGRQTYRPTDRPTDQPTDRPTRVDLEAPSPELKN